MIKIFLVGLPGSGKSTWGKRLSKVLALRFIDLDEEIEKDEQATISSIFEQHGEEAFRAKEHQMLSRFLDHPEPFVLATGGGTPCYYDQMASMNAAGLTIYLTAPVADIVERIQGKAHRPLLANTDPMTKISELLARRESDYKQAKLSFDTSAGLLEELMEKIKKSGASPL